MKCPRCQPVQRAGPYRDDGGEHARRSSLVRRTHPAGVEIDGCDECGGAFLDEGELRSIEAAARSRGKPEIPTTELLSRAYRAGRSVSAAQAIACPSCGEEMVEGEWGFGTMVRIDVCPGCGGAWADAGEIEDIERFVGKPAP